MKKKNILFLLLVSFLASCSSGTGPSISNGSESNDDPESETPSDLKFDENGDPIFNGVELKFWSISIGADGAAQSKIVNRFNEEFEGQIYVTREEKRHDEFSSAIVNTVTLDTKNAPDIVVGHGERLSELQTQNIYIPLDEPIANAKINFDRNNYFDQIMDQMYLEDSNGEIHQYGLPLDVHSNIFLVRKDILEANGLEIPTTFDELINVCKTLSIKAKEGTYKYRQIAKYDEEMEWRTRSTNYELYPLYTSIEALDDEMTFAITGPMQNGTKMVDDKGLPAWNTPSTISYFEKLRGLMYPTDDSPAIMQKSLDYEFKDAFFKGDYIFCNTGPWNIKGIRTLINSDLGFGEDSFKDSIAILPLSGLFASDPESEAANTICGTAHTFSLTKACTSDTKQAAAMVFADWMTKQYVEWNEAGHLPILKSAMSDEELLTNEFYLEVGQHLGDQNNFTLGGATEYYNEIFGIEKQYGLVEVWDQTLNTNTQGKSIETIVNEQYQNTLALINEIG